METLIKKSFQNGLKIVFKIWILLFTILCFSTSNVWANSIDAKKSLPLTKVDRNGIVIKAQINEDKQDFMSYVYMAVGLAVIFGVAWFTVVGKRKRDNQREVGKHQETIYRHSSYDKRYGTHRFQGMKKIMKT